VRVCLDTVHDDAAGGRFEFSAWCRDETPDAV